MTNINLYADLEAEKAFLQAIFWQPDLIYQTSIRTTDLYNTENQKIYTAMIKCYSEGLTLEAKTIFDIDTSISFTTLFNITSGAFTADNFKYYENLIKEKSFNRTADLSLKKLLGNIGSEEFLTLTEKTVLDLQEFYTDAKYKPVPEVLMQLKADRLEAFKSGVYGISTGFPLLDNACIGLCPSHLWTLGAYTSWGKSTFLSQLVSNICRNGAGVIVFSVEDSAGDKLNRLIATESGIPIRDLVKGQCGDLSKVENIIANHNLEVYDNVYGLEEMSFKIKRHKMQKKIDVVCVDFVQNIISKGESIYDRMSHVAIGLQQMAKRHKVCIFALSQVSEGKDKHSISLRGAQELSSASDIVLWIDRDPDEREFNLIIRKNRPFGITGSVKMTFSQSYTNIKEVYDG